MHPVFLYALNDPTTGITRYCGQTLDPDVRLSQHLSISYKEKWHVCCWIQSLLKKNLRPVIEIIDVVPDNEADFWEREYIQNFRELGFDLTNTTPGGDSPPVRRGWHHTPEWKTARSAAISGKNHPDFGKKHLPERVEKNRLAHLGKKMSPAAIAKRTASCAGKKTSRNTSGFVGVSRDNFRNNWLAQVFTNNKCVYSGRFKKIEDAVFARALGVAIQKGI